MKGEKDKGDRHGKQLAIVNVLYDPRKKIAIYNKVRFPSSVFLFCVFSCFMIFTTELSEFIAAQLLSTPVYFVLLMV